MAWTGAARWYHAFDAAVDSVERVVREENIACDFERTASSSSATKPAHYEALARSAERMRREVDARCRADRCDARAARGSAASASSAACCRRRARRCTWAASRTAWRRQPNATARRSSSAPRRPDSNARAARMPTVSTPRAHHRCEAGAARHRRVAARRLRSFGWLRGHRRIGSFIIVTEPWRGARASRARGAPHLRDGREHPPLLPPDGRPPARCSAGARASRCPTRTSDRRVGAILTRARLARNHSATRRREDRATAGAALVDMTQGSACRTPANATAVYSRWLQAGAFAGVPGSVLPMSDRPPRMVDRAFASASSPSVSSYRAKAGGLRARTISLVGRGVGHPKRAAREHEPVVDRQRKVGGCSRPSPGAATRSRAGVLAAR